MLCDVISTVAEFMVRVLHPMSAVGIHDVAGDEARPYARSNPICLSGTVRVFRHKFTLEDAIGSHACSLEANTRVTNGIPLGSSLLLPVCTVNCAQTLKVHQVWVFS